MPFVENGAAGGGGSSSPTYGCGLTNLASPLHPGVFTGDVGMDDDNDVMLCRVIVPVAGTLTDLAIFPIDLSGNIDVGVYSVAATRARLFHTGSIDMTGLTANQWNIVGDPNLAVGAGEQLDFAIQSDDALNSGFLGTTDRSKNQQKLPTGFLGNGAGITPFLGAESSPGSFGLPATIADAALSADLIVAIIARVVPT